MYLSKNIFRIWKHTFKEKFVSLLNETVLHIYSVSEEYLQVDLLSQY